MSRVIYFISHPDVKIDPQVPVEQWSLSEKGRQRFRRLMLKPWVSALTSVYCSCETKAVEGAELLAKRIGCSIATLAELGENDRSSTGYLPAAEFEVTADCFFATPDVSVRGWETASDAQHRIVKAVERIHRNESSGGAVAIVSHGAVGTLLYCHLNNKKIDRVWDQPGSGGGNFMIVDFGSAVPCLHWQPID